MKKSTSTILGIMLLFSFTALFAATNYVQEGNNITLNWATTSPVANAAVIKCAAKATGGIVGVAMNGSAVAGENVTVQTTGIFNVGIVASSTIGNMATGDYVYASVGGIEVCTTTLSNISSGLLWGQLVGAAVTASTTPGVSQTRAVRLLQPSHL